MKRGNDCGCALSGAAGCEIACGTTAAAGRAGEAPAARSGLAHRVDGGPAARTGVGNWAPSGAQGRLPTSASVPGVARLRFESSCGPWSGPRPEKTRGDRARHPVDGHWHNLGAAVPPGDDPRIGP